MNPVVKQFVGLAGWLAATFAAAALAAVASADAGEFYRQLDRPPWAPPGWLFAPVWTVLYLLMGIAAWLVWRERGFGGTGVALTLFLVQLGFNVLWTWLFFVWRLGGLSLAEILVLDLVLAATVATFWRVRAVAGALLLPYVAWVLLATALAYSVWQRNPLLV